MHVGITVQNIKHPSYSEWGHYLNIRWQAFANEIGFTLIPLTSIALTEKIISEKYIKAVILSGGGNLSKEFSNKNLNKKSLNNINLQREEIERILIKFSLKTNTPLIGVCRGMQALGMYFGGHLSHVDKHVNTRHSLDYYCPVLNSKINRDVNSYHDFGIESVEVPKCFEINAKYMNSVEQIIHENKKMLGIMWHPEREDKFSKLDIKLFRKFLNIK